MWTGTRLLIGAVAFAFASLAFAYFYLRSSNSEGLWRLHGESAPTALGTAIFAVTVAAAALLYLGNLRRRQGANLDWQVAGWTVVVLGLLTVALQILELTTAQFLPRLERLCLLLHRLGGHEHSVAVGLHLLDRDPPGPVCAPAPGHGRRGGCPWRPPR